MPSHAEFIANICQHPTLMGPRLVYADWLEELGDVRSEFIRMQIRSVELEQNVMRWVKTPSNRPGGTQSDGADAGTDLAESQLLLMAANALLTPARRREWTMAGLPKSACYNHWTYDGTMTEGMICMGYSGEELISADFARGFPEVLTLRFEELERHYHTLIDAMPVRQVKLTQFNNACDFTNELFVRLYTKYATKPSLFDWFGEGGFWGYLLSAEFPGHDREQPIKYTLPANVVTDGFVQVDFEPLFQTAAPD